MFKYLWILILVLITTAFIAYTAYTVRDFCLKHKVEFEDWGELFSKFDYEHGILLGIWCVIIAVAILFLFITSVVAYSNSID